MRNYFFTVAMGLFVVVGVVSLGTTSNEGTALMALFAATLGLFGVGLGLYQIRASRTAGRTLSIFGPPASLEAYQRRGPRYGTRRENWFGVFMGAWIAASSLWRLDEEWNALDVIFVGLALGIVLVSILRLVLLRRTQHTPHIAPPSETAHTPGHPSSLHD
ncbi:hypothetical protein VVR84_14685 [Kocuria carniphila]|uniref:hypothetical protein n=1 Tax=Kocuria carniphila TaxID=262208 RepID=UPI0034CD954A